jgi:hypothetical protein
MPDEYERVKPLKELSAEELCEYNAAAQLKTRDKKRTKTEENYRLPHCKNEPSRKDALSILANRGITNAHVQETLYDLAEQAAHNYKLPANSHML